MSREIEKAPPSLAVPAIRRLCADAQGTITILTAVVLLIAVGATALAVDMGSLYVERRKAQGAVDLAAMAAAANLSNAEAAARATLTANGIGDAGNLLVELGHYEADPSISHEQRFVPGHSPQNAARVTLAKPGNIYFAKAFTRRTFNIQVSATAASGDLAAYSIGSRLLAVRDGVVNSLLGGLLGSKVSLSVMDYDALVKSDIDLMDFMDALATHVNVTGGTYGDVLNASATVGDVLAAAADVAEKSSDATTVAALKVLVAETGGTALVVPLNALIGLGPIASLKIGDPAARLGAKIAIMQLISGAAVLADGSHQVAIDLAANIPGLLDLKLEVAIGEPPQHAPMVGVGQPASIVRTAQTRLKLTAGIGGTGVLAGARLRLPIYLDLAYAEGRLADVICPALNSGEATIAARPGVVEAWIGEAGSGFTDFAVKPTVAKATIVDLKLAQVRGSAHIDGGNISETMLSFNQSDIDDATIKRTDTRNLTQSLVTSLLKNLKLDVQVLGLGLGLGNAQIEALVANLLASVAVPLDDVAYELLSTLGVHIGEADVRVHGVRCNGSGTLAG